MSGESWAQPESWVQPAQSSFRELYDGQGIWTSGILSQDNFDLIEQVDWNYVQTFCAWEVALSCEETSAAACHAALHGILGAFYAESVFTEIEEASFAIEAEALTGVLCDRALTLARFVRDFDRCFVLGYGNGDAATVWSESFQPRLSQIIKIVKGLSRFECALLTNDRFTLLWDFVSACGSIDVTGSVPVQTQSTLSHAICIFRDWRELSIKFLPPIFLPEDCLLGVVKLQIHEFWGWYLVGAQAHLLQCLKYHRNLISSLLSINDPQELSAAINRLNETDRELSLKINPLYQMYRTSTNGEKRTQKRQNGKYLPQAYAGAQGISGETKRNM